MVRISVVVPTFERSRQLKACLTALAGGFPPDAETVVVDDGGRVQLEPVVAPFVERLRLRLLKTTNGGPAAARNRGLAEASGDIVVFTDDDCRPHPGWVAAIASGVTISPPRAVGGTTHNGLPANAYADASQLVLNLLSRHDRAMVGRERLLPSNNFAFPAARLRSLGGFDERFRTAEDRDLCRRWAAAGYALGRVPSAVVEHDPQLDFSGFIRKCFAYGRGAARFHATETICGLKESAHFHVRLPALLLPELRRRGPVRGLAITGLLAVWELANLAGYLAERATSRQPFEATGAVGGAR
jgi:GT2 family glycosyltransferase